MLGKRNGKQSQDLGLSAERPEAKANEGPQIEDHGLRANV